MESWLVLAENVYVILPTPLTPYFASDEEKKLYNMDHRSVNVMKLFSFVTDDEAQ